jgi:hypothetical protein
VTLKITARVTIANFMGNRGATRSSRACRNHGKLISRLTRRSIGNSEAILSEDRQCPTAEAPTPHAKPPRTRDARSRSPPHTPITELTAYRPTRSLGKNEIPNLTPAPPPPATFSVTSGEVKPRVAYRSSPRAKRS